MEECVGAYVSTSDNHYRLYGVYHEDTKPDDYDYYELYDHKGNCINEGEPLYDPKLSSILDLVKRWEE